MLTLISIVLQLTSSTPIPLLLPIQKRTCVLVFYFINNKDVLYVTIYQV